MEHMSLLRLDDLLTKIIIEKALDQHSRPDWPMVTFSGLPTAMLFRPNRADPGSFHYMSFPTNSAQRFHYHPSGRYLILLSDIPLYIYHNPAPITVDPHPDASLLIVASNELTAIRIPAEYWHQFSTNDDHGYGAIAFSIHGDDYLDNPDAADDCLMEEVTIYWEGTAVH